MAYEQDLKPDLILGTFMYPAVPILASRRNLPFINYFPAGAIEPFFTTLWRGSGRRVFLPNPLSYHPQMDLHVTSQHLVGHASCCSATMHVTQHTLQSSSEEGCVVADLLGAAPECLHLPQVPLQ